MKTENNIMKHIQDLEIENEKSNLKSEKQTRWKWPSTQGKKD